MTEIVLDDELADSSAAPRSPATILANRVVVLPAILFALLSTGVLVAWGMINRNEARAAEEQAALLADQTARRLKDFINGRLLVVEVVRNEMAAGLTPDRDSFEARTVNLQREFEGFHAINWIDAEGVIRWVSPQDPNRTAVGRNIFDHPVASAVIAAAKRDLEPRMTPPLDLFQGGRAFTTYYPVIDSFGELTGFVNGVFLIDRLIDRSLHEGMLGNFEILLRDVESDGLVYGAPERFAQLTSDRDPAQSTIELLGRRWILGVTPKSAHWERTRGDFHAVFLIGGIALALALASALFLALHRQRQQHGFLEERAEFEERMRQVRKLEAIGQLAGGVAHEFNNLLTAVLANADLIRHSNALRGSDAKALAGITEAGLRAARVTAQLLTFSRKQAVSVRRLDVSAEIQKLRSLLDPLVREDVTLDFDLARKAGVVEMDPVQLGQAVMNLVVNSVDAMPGGGQLHVSTRPEARGPNGESGRWVRISVRDDGVGMNEAVRARVLEPFFTTKPVGKGTGLGLSTVYGVVTGAGGTLDIQSTPGGGTTIDAWVPASDGVPDRDPQGAEKTRPRLRGTVLVVEDEPAVLDVVTQMLTGTGLRVLRATDGEDALEVVAREDSLDLLVTDLVMPRMGGVELVEKLHLHHPGLRTVVCSGYSADLGAADLEALNAIFVPKPYSRQQLLDAVKSQLAASRVTPPT